MKNTKSLNERIQEQDFWQLFKSMGAPAADFYKFSHWLISRDDLDGKKMYMEPRIGAEYEHIVFFGLQTPLKIFLSKGNIPTSAMIDIFGDWYMESGADVFPRHVYRRIRKEGRVPMDVYALPEGVIVEPGTPLFQVKCTAEWFAPHMAAFEDRFMTVWEATTKASEFLQWYKDAYYWYSKTNSLHMLPYAVNDFSLRGTRQPLSAMVTGMSHLLFYNGSDNNVADICGVRWIYRGKGRLQSVMASEHNNALEYGPNKFVIDGKRGTKLDGEVNYITKMVTLQIRRKIPVTSTVTDTYDDDAFIELVKLPQVKKLIERCNKMGFRVVWRPDTGVPYERALKYFAVLEETFGSHIESGYKVINGNLGVILGDSIDIKMFNLSATKITKAKWSMSNIVFGSGKGLYANGNRDTLRFAIKCHGASFNGKWQSLMKNPKGTPGKRSKGEFKVVLLPSGKYKCYEQATTDPVEYEALVCAMELIWNGKDFVKEITFEEVRANLAKSMAAYGYPPLV